MAAVFYDPTRSRQRFTRLFSFVVIVAGAIALTLFVVTLVEAPRLPALWQHTAGARTRPFLHRGNTPRSPALRNARRKLLAEIARERRTAAAPSASIVAAFYAPWQETGLHSLQANAGRLTHLMPVWLRLSPDGRALDFTDWNPAVVIHNNDVVRVARERHVKLYPVLSNAAGSQFDAERAHALLTNPNARASVVAHLRGWLIATHMDGVNLDFERLTPEDAALVPGFAEELARALRPHGFGVSADVEAANDPAIATALAKTCDFVVVMGYDQHGAASKPGPVSSLAWYRKMLDRATSAVPRDKLVIGVGNYGYDWSATDGGSPVSYEQALMTARDAFGDDDAPRAIDFDPDALNPTFDYTDDDGVAHEVWFLDGVTAANQWRLAQSNGVRGVAVWALGLEDPSVWRIFGRDTLRRPASAAALSSINFPYDVEFLGDGEILEVAATPNDGHRSIELDPSTGLGVDETYEHFPTPFVVRRTGYMPRAVALTIDDGPSDPYTDRVLDVLKKYDMRATFFVIGENLERYPDLVRRIWNEGHDIGSHTYTHTNMGEVSDLRATLELNATQRAIETVTGHSTVLFRPPYNADAEPSTREEVLPVVRAASLGYATVGEFIDPQDWAPNARAPQIVASILEGVRHGRGNCVLLHDGGGNRAETVKALEIVIPRLKAEGYRFVTVSQLMHSTRSATMPAVAASDRLFLRDDSFVFGATSRAETFLAIAFLLAIFLGIARIVVMTALAISRKPLERRAPSPAGTRETPAGEAPAAPTISEIIAAYNEATVIAKTIASVQRSSPAGTRETPAGEAPAAPTISVIIAAYNEATVIAKTIASVQRSTFAGTREIPAGEAPAAPTISVIIAAYNEATVIAKTIASVQRSTFAPLEILVVDDGSTDDTAAVVANIAGVRLLRQPNGGKASALNHAIHHAQGEVLVALDADTVLDARAIEKLVAHFADPRVGAVAGNVKVGNRGKLATMLQSIEYITSQNLDRRAWARLNAITVVPGAIGAWRRDAVEQAGGYAIDTMAEDMDLTWTLREAGWVIANENDAISYTEAPESVRALFRQRFRWAFGTLQCLWKHRRAFGRYGWFGAAMIPSLWLFQIALPLLSPVVDLQILRTLAEMLLELATRGAIDANLSHSLALFGAMFALFTVTDTAASLIAFRIEGERLAPLPLLVLQRFFYRQVMYAAIFKSVLTAIQGLRTGWNKLERLGTVEV